MDASAARLLLDSPRWGRRTSCPGQPARPQGSRQRPAWPTGRGRSLTPGSAPETLSPCRGPGGRSRSCCAGNCMHCIHGHMQ
eukprot:363891-Chlamydomonas_euryale.AAC.7